MSALPPCHETRPTRGKRGSPRVICGRQVNRAVLNWPTIAGVGATTSEISPCGVAYQSWTLTFTAGWPTLARTPQQVSALSESQPVNQTEVGYEGVTRPAPPPAPHPATATARRYAAINTGNERP